jgi:RNA polymerase sigma-70 factor (ECF subfamily)
MATSYPIPFPQSVIVPMGTSLAEEPAWPVASRLTDEQVWIRRACAGDHQAFAHVVQAYQGPVYNLCYRVLGDVEEAEDATQETFLRVYTNLHRYDHNKRFLNWILTIASNYCIDLLRKRRHLWNSLDDVPVSESLSTSNETTEHQIERGEQAAAIQRLLNRLPPDYRIPLVLLYWYDFSYEAIAETLQLSVPAVKSRLHRARHRLAEWLPSDPAFASEASHGSLSADARTALTTAR